MDSQFPTCNVIMPNFTSFTDAKGDTFYFSYNTLVAFHTHGKMFARENIFSRTTGKHLNIISNKKERLSTFDFKEEYKKHFKKELI